jgi:hypothetical protein
MPNQKDRFNSTKAEIKMMEGYFDGLVMVKVMLRTRLLCIA